jgi:hypothetical protein
VELPVELLLELLLELDQPWLLLLLEGLLSQDKEGLPLKKGRKITLVKRRRKKSKVVEITKLMEPEYWIQLGEG